ncbi:MAG: pyridoxamine kinase [Clostridia bacterium]|nr:pyridoxamine kinase [Clostridia bacterium]
MMQKKLLPPRVAAIQDLSSVGRCSLTATIPTLSAMGYQVIPLPTALLSTQTWGYDRPYFVDLTGETENMTASFVENGLSFRAIYAGYLASADQAQYVEAFFDAFSTRPDESERLPLLLLDPVLGEDGVFYTTCNHSLADGMKRLARKADVITPNLTEACLLLGEDYRDTSFLTKEQIKPYVEALLLQLQAMGPRRVVITGVPDVSGALSNYGVDETRQLFCVSNQKTKTAYPGTGDLFASVLLGKLLDGASFQSAVAYGASFVAEAARLTEAAGTPAREGVLLELLLPKLFPERNL